jgi:hypothetical protein
MTELVIRNDSHIIAQYLTFDELEEDSLETLEHSNELIAPLMAFIRACKGISTRLKAKQR